MIHNDETALTTWCIDYLATLLDIPTDDITQEASFESLGLDSANSVQFVLALEDHFHHVLDPDVVVNHPSIATLVRFLGVQGFPAHTP